MDPTCGFASAGLALSHRLATIEGAACRRAQLLQALPGSLHGGCTCLSRLESCLQHLCAKCQSAE